MERTDVRLPKQVDRQIDALVESKRFDSRSAVIRHAIQRMPEIASGSKDRYDKGDKKTYSRLDDLEPENVSIGSTRRLEYVLETLANADELHRELVWQSKLWKGCTVEELLGALIEADWVLESYKEQIDQHYTANTRLQ